MDMQETIANDASSSKKGRRKASSSRKSVKNLQKEVEMIFSQEDEEECYDKLEVATAVSEPVTPKSRSHTRSEKPKTPLLAVVQQEALMTPRRSVRKSVKPAQDYNDIVGGSKKLVRSAAKENDVNGEAEIEVVVEEPRWTPAKVGRVSQKRSKRSRKTRGGNKNDLKELQLKEKNDKEKNETIEVHNEVSKECAEVKDEFIKSKQHVELNAPVNEKPLEKKNEDYQLKEETTMTCSEDTNIVLVAEHESKIITENTNVSKQTEETFGNYLKSKDLNISDLGLNPLLTDAGSEEKEATHNEIEKINSTVIVDAVTAADDKINLTIIVDEVTADKSANIAEESKKETEINKETETNQEENKEKGIALQMESNLDGTFNTSDCFIVTPPTVLAMPQEPAEILAVEDDDDCFMQPLILSDDEENEEIEKNIPPVVKTPKVMLTDAEDHMQTLLSSATIAPESPKSSRPKAYRFPTPYKSKKTKDIFKFNKQENKEDEDNMSACVAASTSIALTMLEPKDIVLRSIRKRSLSVCIDGQQQQKRVLNRVTFYSPANQTAVIEDLDELIAKSTNKLALIRQAEANEDKNVTKRRKRSLSFDESMLNRVSKLPRPVAVRPNTPNKQRQTPQKAVAASRTKLPNFAAIHQKHFNKMENLVEHVTRKAERAKELSNSVIKATRPVSAQKGLPIRNQNDVTAKPREKPKALKKIELHGVNTTKPVAKPLTIEDELNISTRLPNPRLAIIKPLPVAHTLAKKKPATVTTKSQATPSKRVLRPATQNLAPTATAATVTTKPAFNLSTHIGQAPTIFSASNATNATNVGANVSVAEDKVGARRKRHMEMFKGRSADTRTARDGVVIRGVRSNRRFELQMQHRRNLDHN